MAQPIETYEIAYEGFALAVPKLTDDEAKLLRATRGTIVTDEQREWLCAHSGDELPDALVGGWSVRDRQHAYPKPFWSFDHVSLTDLGRAALERYDAERTKPKIERRGWVSVRERLPTYGDWLRCLVKDQEPWKSDKVWTRKRWDEELARPRCASGWGCLQCEVWTGCLHCDRPEPHTIDMCGEKHPGVFVDIEFAQGAPSLSPSERVVIGPSIIIGTSDDGAAIRQIATEDEAEAAGLPRWLGKPIPTKMISVAPEHNAIARDVAVDPDTFASKLDAGNARRIARGHSALVPIDTTIACELELARAMFVAANLDEVLKRAEVDRLGRLVRKNREQDVIAIMWADAAYARQRAECEKAAERVWKAGMVR